MKPRLNDYLIPIGRLAIAAAFLEEHVICWGALLSGAAQETHAKRLRRGLDQNLDFLTKQVKQRVSAARQKPVIDLIAISRALKDKRNENVHAVWSEMENADTHEFAHVVRSRYDKDANGKLIWLPHNTPTVAELEKIWR